MSSLRANGEAALLTHDFNAAVLALGGAMAIANDREKAEIRVLQQAAGEGKAATQALNENIRQAELQLQVHKYMRELCARPCASMHAELVYLQSILRSTRIL